MERKYIEILKGKDEKTVIGALKNIDELTPYQKNIIYTCLFPKPVSHMELPALIKETREALGCPRGSLQPSEEETLILLRAYMDKTKQYRRFILHLLHSYVQHEEGIYISQVNDDDLVCGCCGKPLYGYPRWKSRCDKNPAFGEQDSKEYLAYGSNQSNQVICINCMIQLKNLDTLLKRLEGPDYLKG